MIRRKAHARSCGASPAFPRATILWLLSSLLLILPQPLRGQGNLHTDFNLVLDHAEVAPGTTFHAAVLFTMDPGWHIYWENSGDAGIPTVVQWQVPEGVEVRPLRWETPYRFEEPGEIITYGYSGEAMLWSEFRVAADFEGEAIPISANVSWLECKEICIPGEGVLEASIPVREKARELPAPELRKRLAIEREKLAVGDGEHIEAAYLPDSAQPPYGGIRLELNLAELRQRAKPQNLIPRGNYGRLYFFARDMENLLLGRAVVDPSRGQIVVPFDDSMKTREGTFSGILTVPVDSPSGEESIVAYELSFDLADLPTASTSPAEPAGPETAAASFSLSEADFTQAGLSGVKNRSFFYILLIAFVGGLLLNIMPCVLPVISLKVFSLVRQGGESPGRVAALGGVFTLGVWSCFIALAIPIIVLQYLGREVGWAYQFQSPAFNYGMLVLLTVFAMSLFGLFEINLPGTMQEGAQAAAGREGFLGAFGSGILSTILATPCMAPLLAPALGYSLTLSPVETLLIFSFIAFGLAAPFMILSLNPRWTRFLPKPGEWMVTFKHVMGFAMLGAALFPLYVLTEMAEPSGHSVLVPLGLMMLYLGLAAYLIGKYAGLEASRNRRIGTWMSVLLVYVALHVALVEDVLAAAGEPDTPGIQLATADGPASTSAGHADSGVEWVPFSMSELEERLTRGENVFIDFTASWCITCRVNEKLVLSTDEVQERFASGAITPMIADWTKRDDEITRMLKKFGRAGVPFYVLFSASDPQNPIVLPEILTRDIVLEAIQKVQEG